MSEDGEVLGSVVFSSSLAVFVHLNVEAPVQPVASRPGVRSPRPTHHETFNVLKTNGYHLEHNFGHGKKTLANVFLVLNLLAFAFHTLAQLCVLAWRNAMATCGARYRFFEHLRTVTAYIVFDDWLDLLNTIIDPKAQAP